MNKKLLLLALPAVMVLSGCTSLRATGTVTNDFNFFKEDNLAHEELFGAPNQLAPRKLGEPEGDPAGDDPSWTKMPIIGIQFHSYQKDVNDDPEIVDLQDFYAIRYVAAIAGLEGGIIASWTRAVSEKNSNQIKVMEGGHNSTVAYDTLNDGGTPVAATSEGTGYNKYVVYTMADIPAAQDESYVVAYLTLSKEGEEPVKSRVVAAQIDGSHYFSFDSSKNGYFLQGTLGGTANTIWDETDSDATDPENAEKDNSLFEQKVFSAGDKFGLFRFTSSVFQFFGNSTFASSTSASYIKSASIDQYNELYLPGKYTLYVNKDNMVYTAPVNVTTTLYFEPNSNWKSASARFAAYVVNKAAGNTNIEWFDLEETAADSGIFGADIDVAIRDTIIFCRMDPGTVENSWENKWNQTGDLGMPVDYGWLSTPRKYQQETGDKVDWNAYGGEWVAL